MLIPLTRKKFEQLIPILATGPQYAYYWGKFPDFIKRLLISVVSVCLVVFIIGKFILGENALTFFLAVMGGLYWLWAPVYWATLRNLACRRFSYSGFWRGEVLDLFVSEELIGEEQTVNNRGQLVIVENRERRLNIEVGDETGFTTQLQAPLRSEQKAIAIGQTAEMLVMSNSSDLSRISKVSDIYIPDKNLWVSDYPYLARDAFTEVSDKLQYAGESENPRKRFRKTKRRKR
ncbi:MAG: phosphate ABC transporter permease [Aphanothece sp. CMT-3BRIN-NPC111]|jgi:hypothetical protein|nr:phosphate ABC transporter permease [Aphanothece sp. CMT-3BRIN-NPC111]